MRGKSIELITSADLEELISDGVAEDRRLEYKVDIPVSPEMQKAHSKGGAKGKPVDRSWVQGKSLADFGRDAIAEEVVAFANADGGTIIIGMDESDDPPPRAIGINALPDVAGLERRLRDILASCVEPRLPYVAVRAIQTQSDGAGVIIVETAASILGPHWVRRTRKPTIRRDDRCDPLTMPEVHEMVLRNSRSIIGAQRKAQLERDAFVEYFKRYLVSKIPYLADGFEEDAISSWLESIGHSALGAQVVVVPHYDLNLPRLEVFDGLVPSSNSISLNLGGNIRPTSWIDIYAFAINYQKRMLGGVWAVQEGGFHKTVKAYRDGRVIVSCMQHRDPRGCTCSADLVVTIAGFAAGVFDRLRRKSSSPEAPADIYVDLLTRGDVGVGVYEGFGFPQSFGRLEKRVDFPGYTLGDAEDISLLLNEIAFDLMNAGGMPASQLPHVKWSDTIQSFHSKGLRDAPSDQT